MKHKEAIKLKKLVFFKNMLGVSVDNRWLNTSLQYVQIDKIESMDIGRTPFRAACCVNLLVLFACWAFDPWLHASEQMAALFISGLITAGCYSIASLSVTTQYNEKKVFYYDLWTIKRVRKEIAHAQAFNEALKK